MIDRWGSITDPMNECHSIPWPSSSVPPSSSVSCHPASYLIHCHIAIFCERQGVEECLVGGMAICIRLILGLRIANAFRAPDASVALSPGTAQDRG